MKQVVTKFLKVTIIVIGFAVIAGLVWFPLTEGRAANLDLFSIYWDPFIAYMYGTSTPFFVALYQVYKLFGLMEHNQMHSTSSVKALRTIKYCASLEGIFITVAALSIKIFHSQGDDPAGFLALCIVMMFLSVVVATAADKIEKRLQNNLA